MKKIFCLIVLVICIFAFSYSSLAQNEEKTETMMNTMNDCWQLLRNLNGIDIEIEEPTIEAVKSEEEVQYIAEGYFEAFKRFIKSYGSKNISVVLKSVKTVSPQVILPLLEQYCKDNSYELLQYNLSELQENGYRHNGLLNGIAFTSSDIVVEGRKLTISMAECDSNMTYWGFKYVLQKNDYGEWDFTERMIFRSNTF